MSNKAKADIIILLLADEMIWEERCEELASILVVDDDVDVADTIRRSLLNRGHQVTAVYNGVEALEVARQAHPDLIVLDVIMPHIDGIEVCRRLRQDAKMAHVPIIFLTAMDRLVDKIEGFEAGADDYLTKPFDIQELELRVRAVLRRSVPPVHAEPDVLTVGELSLNCRTYEAKAGSKVSLLTPIEFELLHFLMSKTGEVFSSERLLQEVWEYPPGTGDPALVRMHIKNIRDKIETDPRQPHFLRTVSRHGYTVVSG